MLSIFEKPMVVVKDDQFNSRTFSSNLEIPDIRGTKEIHADRYRYWKKDNPKPIGLPIYQVIGHNLIDYMADNLGILIRSLAFERYSVTIVLERESVSQNHWLHVDRATRYSLTSLVNVIDIKYEDFSVIEYSLMDPGEVAGRIIPKEARSVLPAVAHNKKSLLPAAYYFPLNDTSADKLEPYGNKFQDFINQVNQIEGIEYLGCTSGTVKLVLGDFFFNEKSFTDELNKTMLQIFRKNIKNAFFYKNNLFSNLNPEL